MDYTIQQPRMRAVRWFLIFFPFLLFMFYEIGLLKSNSLECRTSPELYLCNGEHDINTKLIHEFLALFDWVRSFVFGNKVLTKQELEKFFMKNCNGNPGNISIWLNNITLPLSKYKYQLAENFTRKYSNPAKKFKTIGRLSSWKGWKTKTHKGILHHASEFIDHAALNEIVKEDTKRRLASGDDDLFKIAEVTEELQTSKYSVPNIVHFIWFGSGRKFRVHNYIAFMGALRYQHPRVILFHHDAPPVGEYWTEAKRFAGAILKMVKRTPPTSIFGNSIKVIEHKADVVRLQLMMEIGGIYIDTDSVFLKPVDTFRNFNMVLPQAEPGALANGIILASNSSWFLRRWYHEYRYFRDEEYGFNSVVVPWAISRFFPQEVKVVRKVMCRPGWSERDLIFNNLIDWSSIYIMHLYSRSMLKKDGLVERPLKQLAVLNTTYGEVARHVIWGDRRPRNVTNWIVTCNLTKTLTMGKPWKP